MSSIIKNVVEQIFNEDIDGITFFPRDSENVDLKGFSYRKKSKYIVEKLGNVYHIMIYKTDDDGYILHKDNFEAILTDPKVYASNIICSGFYGLIVKKTKSSSKLIKQLYSKFENEVFQKPVPIKITVV